MSKMKNTVGNKTKISVLGAGSWGGTLAWLISKKNKINLWTFSQDEYSKIKKTYSLIRPVKLKLNKNINITTDLKSIVKNSEVLIIAVPSNAFEAVISKLKKLRISKKTILLIATKGISNKNIRLSVLLKKQLKNNPFAVLSGPNIALDVISKTPTISVIASSNLKIALKLQEILSSDHFRIYINKDVTGVEIAGALKNVIAIAAGISDGLGFSISTKAALISRGLIEIARILIKEGGKEKTLLGAAGLGDLIATCCSTNSRNYKVGFQLAKGKKLTKILNDLGQVAEGVETVKTMVKLGAKYKINLPIANAVKNILFKGMKPKSVLKKLLSRPLPKYELEF